MSGSPAPALHLVPAEPTPPRLLLTAPEQRPRPPRGWRPPRGYRRLALAGLVLVGAGAVARLLPAPDAASTEIAGAREVTAYELVPGQTLSFSLPPGAADLRVLTNLDLEIPVPAEGLPYAVRVRIPEDGRDDTFPLVAQAALDAAGDRTAFFLGRLQTPARTRMLALSRGSSLPATLEVTLVAGASGRDGTRGSVRVLVAHGLLAARTAMVPRQPATGGLAIDDLAPEARAALDSQSWSRLATRVKTATRGFYVVGDPPAPPVRPPSDGQALGDGHVAAFTVRGPGTLHLETPDGLAGTATLLDGNGDQRTRALALRPGGRESLAVGRGLCTLRISAARPGRVRVLGEARLAVRPEPVAGAREEIELDPSWSWQALALAGPEGPPVEIAVAGRGEAALRLVARLPLGASPLAAPEGTLAWRFVDGRGTVLHQGRLPVAGAPALEDRLDGPASFVSVPTAAFLWAPRGAEKLLLTAVRPIAVSLSSPALESPEAPADQLGIAHELVMRYRESTAFEGVRPLNLPELRRLDRVVRFAGAMRLEPRPEPRAVSEEATSLAPDHGGAQFVLLAPLAEVNAGHQDGVSFVVRPGREETVTVARPRGASARARVAATVYYEIERVRGRGAVTVSLDGQVVRRASVLGKRGQLVLPPVAVGRHKLRVELPSEGRVFVDQPVGGAGAFRRSRVFPVRGGATVVHLPKPAAARSLGVVLYADGPGRGPAALEAVVDGGVRARRTAGLSNDYTRLVRRIPLDFAKVEGARYLNRARGAVWASEPVFIPLGDDLRAGGHRIALRAVGVGGQPLARFFSYGRPLTSRISQHLELRAEDAE